MRAIGPLSLAFLSFLAGPASAADLWLDPLDARPAARGRVGVRAQLGDSARSRVIARDGKRVGGLWVRGPRGVAEVSGREGDDPLGMVPLQGHGLHTLGYRGKVGFGRLAPAGFKRLLRETGYVLPEVDVDPISRVAYRRFAKALLYAGDGGGANDYARPLGLGLELTPLSDPHDLAGEGTLSALSLRLTWGGRPQAKAEVRAFGPQGRAGPSARTDAQGQVKLTLPGRGRWVIASSALRPGVDLAKWEVAFTTLSFDAALQPPAPGSVALGALLGRAARNGRLKKILGTHHFTFARRYHDASGKALGADAMLMTYTLSLGAEGAFRVAVDVSRKGAPHAFSFVYEVSREGRFRSLQNPDGRAELAGQVLSLPKGGRREIDPRLLVPKVVGVFAIPMLADAATPRALRVIDLTPFATLSQGIRFERAGPSHADHDPKHETWVTYEGRPKRTTRVRVARGGAFAGKLVEIQTRSEVDELGRVRALNDCQRISPAEFALRWRTWFGGKK